jgi:hypothetical protein
MNIKKFILLLCTFIPITSSILWGEDLKYHVGISDVQQLTGSPVNIEAIKSIPMHFFMGDQDTNDMVPYSDGYDEDQREQVNRLFGNTPLERWPHAKDIYYLVGCNSNFILYPGVGHYVTEQMGLDVIQFFKDHGNPNEVQAQNFQVIKVLPEDSTKNFDWPYYLLITDNPKPSNAILLVEPNNTGSCNDDPSVHDLAAEQLIQWRSEVAMALNAPLLVPAFPRPCTEWWIYTHALDRDCLTTNLDKLVRIDLQLIEMISDAKERLNKMSIIIDNRVFMMGFSASGAFTNRFSLLHPELIKAAAIGAPGGWPIVPVANWPQGVPEAKAMPWIPLLLGD